MKAVRGTQLCWSSQIKLSVEGAAFLGWCETHAWEATWPPGMSPSWIYQHWQELALPSSQSLIPLCVYDESKETTIHRVTVNRGLVLSLKWQWLARWCHQRGRVLLTEVSASPGRATVQIFTGYHSIAPHQCFIEHYEFLPLRCRGENLSLITTFYRSKRTELRLALDSKIFPSSHDREWRRSVNWMGSGAIPNSDPHLQHLLVVMPWVRQWELANYSPQHVALPD